MTKICYDNDLLQEVCDRDRCIIDFDKIEKYNRDIKVEFVCNCGIEYSRTFRLLYKIGAFCKICGINKKAPFFGNGALLFLIFISFFYKN